MNTCGKMIVEFEDNGTSRPVPHVTFDPVGRITPGLIDAYHNVFCQQVYAAQAEARRANDAVAVKASRRAR